jgi:hypothetical protein
MQSNKYLRRNLPSLSLVIHTGKADLLAFVPFLTATCFTGRYFYTPPLKWSTLTIEISWVRISFNLILDGNCVRAMPGSISLPYSGPSIKFIKIQEAK